MKPFQLVVSVLFTFAIVNRAPAQTQWYQRPSNTSNELYGLGFGNNSFVATGGSIALGSVDGQSWSTYPITNVTLWSVAFGGSVWVGVSSSPGKIYSSADGHTWVQRYTDATLFYGVGYGNGVFVAVGNSGQIRWSVDGGQTWTLALSPTSQSLRAVAYGNGIFVAIGLNGAVVTSPDGYSWTLGNANTSSSFFDIAYGNGTFVAVGQDAHMTSSDGQAWTLHSYQNIINRLRIAYGGNTFVAVGSAGLISTSTDNGQNWTNQNSGVTVDLREIAFGNNTWVAVGGNGVILTSSSATGGPVLVPSVTITPAVELQWQTQNGAVYQVQSSPDLTGWSDLGLVLFGDGQTKKFYDTTGTTTKKFYRIQIR